MRFWLCFPFVLAVGCFSAIGHAADTGECGSPEEITARFKAEDQHSFATADQADRRNGHNDLSGLIFTINSTRSVGYILHSDKPTGEKATTLCIYRRLADLRIFDARKPGVQAETLLKASDDEALRHCEQLIKSGELKPDTCGTLNETIRRAEPRGERVMFQGFNTERQADGTYKRINTLTTVTGNVNGSVHDDAKQPIAGILGSVLSSSVPDGATIGNLDLFFAAYTPYGVASLQKR